jgi:hypothetical protein
MLFIGKFQMSFDPEGAFPGIHHHFVTGLDIWGLCFDDEQCELTLDLTNSRLGFTQPYGSKK